MIFFLFAHCKKNSPGYFHLYEASQVIAVQPLVSFNIQQATAICEDISRFYNKKVLLLKPRAIPERLYNKTVHAWSADSIIMMLSKSTNDMVAEIVGLTNSSIYTTRQFKDVFCNDDHIFGIGFWPGDACIISNTRLMTSNPAILNHRLRNVIIHEIGLNTGLVHCLYDTCIMSKKTGNISVLDNGTNDYCTRCRRKLKR